MSLADESDGSPPLFGKEFRDQLERLFRWRRDVRHFRPDPVPETLLQALLRQSVFAPSVGLSQPGRFVRVRSAAMRAAALANFEAANRDALAGYAGAQAERYARLKLSGMTTAPEHLAVFCDLETERGSGLGSRSMPEMLQYSTVCSVMQLWLSARAEGLGLGWVSILDPERLSKDLAVPPHWRLIGYFCIGWPSTPHRDPELERAGWEQRLPDPVVLER